MFRSLNAISEDPVSLTFQVIHWREKVDRNCIEHLRAFQNPPLLVGLVMEMVMTLIGKRLPSQRLEARDLYPSKDEHSGRFSASSSSTKFTASVKKCKLYPSSMIMSGQELNN